MPLSPSTPHRTRGTHPLPWLLAGLLALGLLAFAQHLRLFERGWFFVREWQHAGEWRAHALWLPDYRVSIEARPIAGVADDLSGLTFDPQRRSLFAVTNANPELLELSLDGRILRRIALHGFRDPEAIEYIAPGLYVVSDERDQRLIAVRLDDTTTRVDAGDGEQLALGMGRNGNKGFEGLAYDAAGRRLFVAKERDPMSIYEIRGFPQADDGQPLVMQVLDDPARDARLFVRDLSSLHFDAASGHLLALSDESRLVLELDGAGRPVSSLSLVAGRHGLERTIPQAEGIAMDDSGNLYLVSEPNLFYVFGKRPKDE
ncbi:SdiA-regulated domain-containing protein [Pseudomonas sp. GCM10022188]|uniref:SdiA-regulated domain-containing protein n=1 Tax=Pseudomonas TaxID=286 RepID=UPI001E3D2757|nr:SdiA-regulated domain-containing protein [Pseudomonas oryzagri]MCC6074459.1 SdiA-regulated domain-containing protein [Pseudomonas oryzagri]